PACAPRTIEARQSRHHNGSFPPPSLPHSTLVCIDAWDASVVDLDVVERMPEAAGAPDKMGAVEEFLKVQRRFDCNLAPFGDRVTKVVGWSHEALAELGVCGETFDVIYVDGDHRALGAYTDCVLAWPLLAPDGIMIIDDYGFMPDLPKDKRPQAGVDRFLETIPRAVRRAAPGLSACRQGNVAARDQVAAGTQTDPRQRL